MTIDLNGAFGTDPSANVATFVKAAKAGQTLTCSKPITVPIGAATGQGSSGPLINLPANLRYDWQLDNLTLLTAPNQPTNAPGTANQPACSIQFGSGAIGGDININIDGNGIHQIDANAENPYGFYTHGIRIWAPTGKFTGRLGIHNIRGVTAISNTDANGVGRTETFDLQIMGGTASGHKFDVNTGSLDGSSPASGVVFQFMPQTSQSFLKINAKGNRHGAGCYGGGNIQILGGSYIAGTGTAVNGEAGKTGTPSIIVGGSVSGDPSQLVVLEGNQNAIVINGNLQPGAPAGTPQVDLVKIQNTWFVHNASDINLTGVPSKRVDVNNCLYYDPTNTAVRFMAGSSTNNNRWAKAVFHNASTYHFTKRQKISIGAALVAANGLPTAV